MDRDVENLEREVEAQWSSLGLDLSVHPSDAVVARVRSAVRQELNEAWLAGQPQPVPDRVLLGRVTAAMHRERQAMTAARVRIVRLRRWLAAGTAAAAAVTLVFGLSRLGVEPSAKVGQPAAAGDVEAIERFVQAADQVWSADPFTSDIREGLDALEESVSQWSLDGSFEETGLEDINSSLDVSGGDVLAASGSAGPKRVCEKLRDCPHFAGTKDGSAPRETGPSGVYCEMGTVPLSQGFSRTL